MSWKEPECTAFLIPDQFETTERYLWKGKKEPFVEAGVIRNWSNFTASGVIDLFGRSIPSSRGKAVTKTPSRVGRLIDS